MVKRAATPYRSANAGEFSPDAKGRVDIKQYYSAGIAYKNIEPVPQSGYRQMGGTRRKGKARNLTALLAITGATSSLGPNAGTLTIWQGTVAGNVAAVYVEGVSVNAGTISISVQALVGGVWTNIGPAFTGIGGTAVARCAAFPPGEQKAATGLRIVATFSTSATATLGTVLAWSETGTPVAPRYCALSTDEGIVFSAFVSPGFVDFFTDANGYCGAARLGSISSAILPDLSFYAEGRTIGLFHKSLKPSQRLFLVNPATRHEWQLDNWPYEDVPRADLGGVYPKTNDVWTITVRWVEARGYYLQLTVDDETTPGIPLTNSGGTLANPGDADWTKFANDIAAAINALPTMRGGVTATGTLLDPGPESGSGQVTITFGGASAGREYGLSATITNSANASALPAHIQIGKTTFEPLFSATRGYPGTVGLVQDRIGYADIPAASAAFALSRVGEYFDLNTESQDSAAAILQRLRSDSNERILAIKESKYVLIFTDRGVYFLTSRTIDKKQPLNVVLASETGTAPNCQPFDLEGLVYYVARDMDDPEGGHQLISLLYDDVSTSYNGNPESLLASHLVAGVMRSVRQRKSGSLDAAKGWLMRKDGRLVACQTIKSQEIVGYCEWIAAAGGLVKEIGIDGRNKLWLAVQRGSEISIEIYDTGVFLQDAVTLTPDLAGNVSGLPYENGAQVWAVADGYVLGPFTVNAGAIALGDSYASALVGRWQAPRWESMPEVYVTPSDDVIWRPGRIYSIDLNVMDTTSIAIGANGQAPQDVKLLEASDPVDQPMPAKTKLISVTGEDLTGFMVGTTAVVTQTRPGKLRVRDLAIGAKL